MIERRSVERFNLQLKTRIHSADTGNVSETIKTVTENISSAGAYFKTQISLLIGTKLTINLFWPPAHISHRDSRKSLIKLSGEVVRMDGEMGMAVKFGTKYMFAPFE